MTPQPVDDLPARIAAARGRMLTADESLAIAVSGGPDSIGLLALALAAFPGRITALTVDHGLRYASAAEAETVAQDCAARGVPHATLRWTGAKPATDLQAAARAARYALMGEWCAAQGTALLLTAHTMEDQAETLLMRLARGSGSAGLAGIRACRVLGGGVELVRPALGLRHADLAAAAASWTVMTDPSNANPRFDRTHVRALLAREAQALPAAALAASAAHLAEVEAALEWICDTAWAGRAVQHGDRIQLDAAGLPDELRRRLVIRALGRLGPGQTPRGAAVVRAIACLDSGRATTLGGVRIRPQNIWVFEKTLPRRQKQG